MLEIDGNDGGGQLLRSSLSLAAVTDTPVRVENVRGNRPEPGLKSQHLTAVELLEELCDATVDGASPGSEAVEFTPGDTRGGRVEVSVGTAGSLTLLFDTVLPLAVELDEPLAVTASGGTAVKWSPPLSTYCRAKLPLCRRFGLQAAVERHRTGFYPAGGGEATLFLAPSTLSELELTERGELVGVTVLSRASHDLTDSDVARRQAETAATRLEDAGLDVLERSVTSTAADSTGSALTVVIEYEETKAGFDALGEPGKQSEAVANTAVDRALAFHEGAAAVDRHVADQLLVFLALASGRMRVPELTDHVESSLSLLERFGFEVSVDTTGTVPVISRE